MSLIKLQLNELAVYYFLDAVASKFGRFGKGNVAQVIVMDEVGCVGVESSLLDCTFSIHDCSHDEDAGVICEGNES